MNFESTNIFFFNLIKYFLEKVQSSIVSNTIYVIRIRKVDGNLAFWDTAWRASHFEMQKKNV